MVDEEFRDALNGAPDATARGRVLADADCVCSVEEFEEAVRVSLFRCQNEARAEALTQLRFWWLLLTRE